MESNEADVKPTIVTTGDIPDKNLFTASAISKLKQSRYEDVWPEDVHAAFMEAVALYPPMGKRRLKYYRVSTYKNSDFSDAHQARSFGRCQLIQSYILEKTGKNRSRKQVSSHLQRLKKIHKDNPAMHPLFSECSRPPSEHCTALQARTIPSAGSQDIFANISFSTHHPKSEFDLTFNLQNTDNSGDSSPSFSHPSQKSSYNCGSHNTFDFSTNFYNQPPPFFPQESLSPQQYPSGIVHPFDSDYLSELQDPSLFTDAINGIRAGSAFNTSALSMSMRRLASKLPIQGRQMDSGPTTHFSHATYPPGLQLAHQWISHNGLMDITGVSYDSPLTPAQQAFHTSFHQPISPEKQRHDAGLACDWIWPQTPDVSPDSREAIFSEVHVRYPAAMRQYNPTYPVTKVNPPGPYGSPFESEISRFPRCSYTATTPAAVSESATKGTTHDFPGWQAISEHLVPPPVFRPTPVYPISYIHPKIHLDEHAPTPSPP